MYMVRNIFYSFSELVWVVSLVSLFIIMMLFIRLIKNYFTQYSISEKQVPYINAVDYIKDTINYNEDIDKKDGTV